MSNEGNRTAEYNSGTLAGPCIFCQKNTIWRMHMQRVQDSTRYEQRVCLSCKGAIKTLFIIEGCEVSLRQAKQARIDWARKEED